jgi:hypothetical protein
VDETIENGEATTVIEGGNAERGSLKFSRNNFEQTFGADSPT